MESQERSRMRKITLAAILFTLTASIGYCQDQSLQLTIKADKGVYEAGEQIKLDITLQNSSDKELIIFWNKWESIVEVGVQQKHEGEGYAVVSNNTMGLDHIERLNIKPKNNLKKEIFIKIKDFVGMAMLRFEYRIPPIPISELIGPNQQLWMEPAISNTITIQVV